MINVDNLVNVQKRAEMWVYSLFYLGLKSGNVTVLPSFPENNGE